MLAGAPTPRLLSGSEQDVTLRELFAGRLADRVDSWPIAVGAFVVGWVFQGIGHAVYEKRSPAFLKNLLHLMVGPLFVLNEALHLRTVQTVRAE